MAEAIIRARGLTKIYMAGAGGDVVAVDGIDLEIFSGEIYGLLGPNGAGKSTTIGMLTTRVVPTRGSILIGGVDLVAKLMRGLPNAVFDKLVSGRGRKPRQKG